MNIPRHILLRALLGFQLFCATTAQAQLDIKWDLSYGGTLYEETNAVIVLNDGIVVGGSSKSNQEFGDPTGCCWNMLIVKLDFDGNEIWRRFYGGYIDDRLWNLIQTADGGFLAVGFSYSDVGFDKSEPSRGDKDIWLLKLDKDGLKQWDKTLGGPAWDEAWGVLQMPDGGYIIAGQTISNAGGDKSQNGYGYEDLWMMRTDPTGNLIWERTVGGNKFEQVHDMIWAADGHVFVSGGTWSDQGSGNLGNDEARGEQDYLLMKMDPYTGSIDWIKRYGGAKSETAYALKTRSNGNILLGGGSYSGPDNAYNGKTAPNYGQSDYWLLELDQNGNRVRDYGIGGTAYDEMYALQENSFGDLLLGGISISDVSGLKETPCRGAYDYWLVGIDQNYQKRWEQTLGGPANDAMTEIALLPNGAYIFSGHSESDVGGDKTDPNKGTIDYWIISTECGMEAEVLVTDPPPCADEEPLVEVSVADCWGCQYAWNTGDTTAQLRLPPGTKDTFRVFVRDLPGCFWRDSAVVFSKIPATVELNVRDTLLPVGSDQYQLLVLSPQPQYSYAWSNGETGTGIRITEDGAYGVTVTSVDGCTASDAALVRFEREKTAFWVPNIFSANFDGDQDRVNNSATPNIQRIKIFEIADRWGEIVWSRKDFLPNNPKDGWDGDYRGRPAEPGVYLWYAKVVTDRGEEFLFSGSVTLVR
jgi:hypothetical protein